MDFLGPLLGADGISVETINYRVAAGLGCGVAGRQKDEDVAVNRFAFQIALQGRAMNL
jgi:hypothetical protein